MDGEGGSVSFGGRDLYVPTVAGDDPLHHVKTQPQVLRITRRGATAPQWVEDLCDVLALYGAPVVVHGEHDLSRVPLGGHRDGSPSRAVADRIAEEVAQPL